MLEVREVEPKAEELDRFFTPSAPVPGCGRPFVNRLSGEC